MRPEEDSTSLNTDQQPRTRRTVRLTVPDEPARPVAPRQRRTPAPVRVTPNDRLLRVAELVVGDWAPTLREALLRVVLFTGVLVALGIAFGSGVALTGALVGFVMFLAGRSRRGADED